MLYRLSYAPVRWPARPAILMMVYLVSRCLVWHRQR